MARNKRIIVTPGQLRSAVVGSWRRVEKRIEEKSDGCQMNLMHPIFRPVIQLVSAYRAMTKQQVDNLDLKAMKKQVVDTWEQVRENGRVIKYSWTCRYLSLKDALEPFYNMMEPLKYEVYPDAPKPWAKNNRALAEDFIKLWLKVKPVALERLVIECKLDAIDAENILSPMADHVKQWQYDLEHLRNVAVNADDVLIHNWERYVSSINHNKTADVFREIKVPEACIAVLSVVLEPVRDFVNRMFHAKWDHRPMWERPYGDKTDVDKLIVPIKSSSVPKLQRPSSPPTKPPSPPKPPKLQRQSSSPIQMPRQILLSSPPKLQTQKLRPGECQYGKIVNPLTKKCIDTNGKLARMLRLLRVIK